MHFVYKKIMTVNYLSPTGSIPTYQRIPVGSTTAPIERQSFINKDDVTDWTNTKKEQAEIELQEAEHFFAALCKVVDKVQDLYQKSDKSTRVSALNKTKEVLADKCDYFFNKKCQADTQENDCFYNKKLSRSAALISRDVYNNEQKEINGYKPVEKLEDAQTGLRVVTYKKNNDIIVAYCGTNDVKDFVSDAQMAMNEVPEQFEKANQYYLNTVEKNPNASVMVTGHSLGGSLAQLVASKNRTTSAITFNAFGIKSIMNNKNKESQEVFQDNKNSFNYIIMGDPVSNSTQHVGVTTRLKKTAINNHSIANYINLWA